MGQELVGANWPKQNQFILSRKQSLQRNVAVVYLSSLCWQRVHYTPISMKSRLIMIKFSVRPSPFYPGIFSGMSPSSGQQGGPPVRPAGGHFASFVHRCPRGHAGREDVMPVAGSVGRLLISVHSSWKVGIDAFGIPFPGSWFGRMVVGSLSILTIHIK